jgi:hypothetical protein
MHVLKRRDEVQRQYEIAYPFVSLLVYLRQSKINAVGNAVSNDMLAPVIILKLL